jgi:hypothetical protein
LTSPSQSCIVFHITGGTAALGARLGGIAKAVVVLIAVPGVEVGVFVHRLIAVVVHPITKVGRPCKNGGIFGLAVLKIKHPISIQVTLGGSGRAGQ